MDPLEKSFNDRMLSFYHEIGNATGYWPHYFLRGIRNNGGLQAAMNLLKPGRSVSKGFLKLSEIGQLNLSIEALILSAEWRALFTQEMLNEARRRLWAHGYQLPEEKPDMQTDEWSDKELRAAARAYLEMRAKEQRGSSYSKSEYNEMLRNGALSGRTRASVEFRMQNISAALSSVGLPWIKGYKPAKNVGANVTRRLIQILAEVKPGEFEAFVPAADGHSDLAKTKKILSRPDFGRPEGSQKPPVTTRSVVVFERSQAVCAYVRKEAKGCCELCGERAPFLDESGEPFLEVHHVEPLGNGGPDIVENAAALCPNCHRQLHHGKDRKVVRAKLYNQVSRLRPPEEWAA